MWMTTVGIVTHTTIDQVETSEHKWVDLSLEGLTMHNKVTREALTLFKDEMHIQQERKSAPDQRWLSAPPVVKLENINKEKFRAPSEAGPALTAGPSLGDAGP